MKKTGIFLIIFIIAGFGLYSNSLQNGYHYDDWHHIVRNPYIRTLDNIPLYFTEPRTFSTKSAYHSHYRPLVLLSYAFNYNFGGANPGGYHLVNLAFHIGSAYLLFLILKAMLCGSEQAGDSRKSYIPLAAGLLFLTTPFNSEVVNYLSARSSVMCAFFYLLSFYCWVKFRGKKSEIRSQKLEVRSQIAFSNFLPLTSYLYLASLLAFLLAMLTKEIAITLPLILWLYDLYFVYDRPSLQWRNYLSYIPFLATGIFTGVILRIILFGQFGIVRERGLDVQFLTQIKALARYFSTVLVPIRLSIWHHVDATLDFTFWISLIFVAGLIVFAYVTWRSRNPGWKPEWRIVSFFILWFFITLLPTGVIPLVAPYQENRGYLAGVGVIGAAAICIGMLRKVQWERPVILSLGLVLALYSIGVIKRNYVWHDDLTLCTDILKKYPQSSLAHLCLGEFYARSGQQDTAEREFRSTLAMNPEDTGALINLGIITLAKGGNNREAESLFLKALKQRPDDPLTRFYLGAIYEERGDLDKALDEYLQVLKITPDNMKIAEPLVRVSNKMGMMDRAYKNFSFLKKKDPNNPVVRRALGLIYQQKGRFDLAAMEYKEALRLTPEDIPTLTDLGSVYLEMNALPQAEEIYKHTLSLWPFHYMARIGLAKVYQKQGRMDLAKKESREVLESLPEEEKNSQPYIEAQKILGQKNQEIK